MVGTNISCIKCKTECFSPTKNSFPPFVSFSQEFAMIFTVFLVAFVGVLLSQAASETSDNEFLLLASQGSSDDAKASNLLPELDEADAPLLIYMQSAANRGRSDIEIVEDQPSGGYFYPKPSKAFNLPAFNTLDVNVPLDGVASFAQESVEVERVPRSPQRRPPYFPSPPPFVPGIILPNQIRPRPYFYGRPRRY